MYLLEDPDLAEAVTRSPITTLATFAIQVLHERYAPIGDLRWMPEVCTAQTGLAKSTGCLRVFAFASETEWIGPAHDGQASNIGER
jgi:hypothetical protein